MRIDPPTKELKDATGLKAGVVGKKIKKDKARKGDETHSIHIKSGYINAIEFGARQTKKGVSAKIWGVRKIYRGAFIGSGRNSGKQSGRIQIMPMHTITLDGFMMTRTNMKKLLFHMKKRSRSDRVGPRHIITLELPTES